VRDLALSMALPERRVRVVLSVLEAMGVAKEVRAARWAGVEPRPTRQEIDKASMVFESRRISDRRRLAELLKYMNLQSCRVQMMRTYFGEDAGPKCGLCDSCAGLDSEVFDPGEADERHGLHAATDFHGRARRRRRRGADKPVAPGKAAAHVEKQRPMFATAIPEVMPATVPPPWVSPPESDAMVDPTVWEGELSPGIPAAGEIVLEPGENEAWLGDMAGSAGDAGNPEAFLTAWAAVRDANIRPFVEWIAPSPVSLPVMPSSRNGGGQPRPGGGSPHRPQPPQGGQQAGDGDHAHQNEHLRPAAHVAEAGAQAGQHALLARLLLHGVADAREGKEHGQKTQAVQKEVAGHAHQGDAKPGMRQRATARGQRELQALLPGDVEMGVIVRDDLAVVIACYHQSMGDEQKRQMQIIA